MPISIVTLFKRRIFIVAAAALSIGVGHSANASATSNPKVLHDGCGAAYAAYTSSKSASEEAELARIRAWEAFLDCFLGIGVR